MLKILAILILLSFQIYSGEQEIKAYMKQQNSKLDNKTADRIYKNVIYYSKHISRYHLWSPKISLSLDTILVLAFYCSGGNTFNDVTLQEQKQNQDREHSQKEGGHYQSEVC